MDETLLDMALDVWAKGGFVMWFLAPVTLLLWFGLGARIFALRRGTPFQDQVRPLRKIVEDVRQGRRKRGWGIVDAAVLRALPVVDQRPRYLRAHLEEAVQPLRDEADSFRAIVTGAALVAPLAGLLGTVTGMIETFESLNAGAMFTAGGGGIGAGVSEALVSTQAGLVVAVPGILIGALLLRKQRKHEDELDQLVDLLCAEGGEA
jgi:biopolymer transport protein ExbB